jgi:hypothetical protein
MKIVDGELTPEQIEAGLAAMTARQFGGHASPVPRFSCVGKCVTGVFEKSRAASMSQIQIRTLPLRVTPAMAAGVSDRLWTLEELVEQTSS